ncbi:MAG: pyrroline-5-carboxylate reductase [Lachnospiraceae bacterium]|nr:pyrroline-5-carboxylate reductase [Lachnospiraceae bacterium]
MNCGFIGIGNMGSALARAVCKTVPGSEIFLSNRTASKSENLARELQVKASTNREIAETCDYIFLGVKPQMMADMLSDIKDTLAARQKRFILISMAAALTTEDIEKMAGGKYPVIRIMPNTPVSIGEGVVLYTTNDKVTEEDLDTFLKMLKYAGLLVAAPEDKFDAYSALSGCGPAFVDLFMEALADGAVSIGVPRDKALQLAAKMVSGSADLMLKSGKHPGELKDAVCSPGGTTIAGVRTLEEFGLRGAVMDAVIESYEKTLELKK